MSPRPCASSIRRFRSSGRAVRGVGGERHHAVVAPVARAGEVGQRHQLDRGDPEVDQVIEPAPHAVERALLAERADVQLVQHRLFPGAAAPRRRAAIRTLRDRRSRSAPPRPRAGSARPDRARGNHRGADTGSGCRPERRRWSDRRSRPRADPWAGPAARPPGRAPPPPGSAPRAESGLGRRAAPRRRTACDGRKRRACHLVLKAADARTAPENDPATRNGCPTSYSAGSSPRSGSVVSSSRRHPAPPLIAGRTNGTTPW